jgi:6-phosphofructo-2-kinase / fructose-2,6-biphosphatase 2
VEGERMRRAAAEAAVTDMLKFFKNGGIIAILDATNSTKARRRWIKERCDKEGVETLFVESKCDDEELIMSNILEVKTSSPDYSGQDPEKAAQDFRNRIRNYEKVYETIDKEENDLTYLKIMNVGKQVIINAIQDYLQSRVVYYLMNLHIKQRSIWLSRVSLPFQLLQNTPLIDVLSTASHNGTSMAKSVATQTSLHEAKPTHSSSLN